MLDLFQLYVDDKLIAGCSIGLALGLLFYLILKGDT
jgi:hypothetical protein